MMILDAVSSLQSFFINPWVNGLILGILVLGVFLSFRVLNIADLSVEGIVPMITMLTAVLIGKGVNPLLVILISMGLGAACGLLNAAITIFLKTPPLLSGIGVMALTFGVAILINSLVAGQASFNPSENATVFSWLRNLLNKSAGDAIGRFYASYFSYIIVALFVLMLVWFALYFFFGTELGMAIRASGKNKAMSLANGINVNRMNFIALAISGALIGLSASLYGQHNGMGLPTDGQGMIVVALSSLFLGEILIGTRSFKKSMISCLVGSLLYWYLIQALMLLDTTGAMLSIYKALLLIAIIALKVVLSHFKKNWPRKGRKNASNSENGTNQSSSMILEIRRHCLGEDKTC